MAFRCAKRGILEGDLRNARRLPSAAGGGAVEKLLERREDSTEQRFDGIFALRQRRDRMPSLLYVGQWDRRVSRLLTASAGIAALSVWHRTWIEHAIAQPGVMFGSVQMVPGP